MKSKRRLGTAFVVVLAAGAMATFGVSSGSATGSPVTIGASLSLSGDFSADGQAFQRGYQLWATDQNARGEVAGERQRGADHDRRAGGVRAG